MLSAWHHSGVGVQIDKVGLCRSSDEVPYISTPLVRENIVGVSQKRICYLAQRKILNNKVLELSLPFSDSFEISLPAQKSRSCPIWPVLAKYFGDKIAEIRPTMQNMIDRERIRI